MLARQKKIQRHLPDGPGIVPANRLIARHEGGVATCFRVRDDHQVERIPRPGFEQRGFQPIVLQVAPLFAPDRSSGWDRSRDRCPECLRLLGTYSVPAGGLRPSHFIRTASSVEVQGSILAAYRIRFSPGQCPVHRPLARSANAALTNLVGTRPSSQCRPDPASDLRISPTSARRTPSDSLPSIF